MRVGWLGLGAMGAPMAPNANAPLGTDSLGRDVSREIGAALGAIGAEANQAMRHLPLGSWRSISCECEDANLAIAPSDNDAVIVVAAAPGIPIGFVRRVLDHAAQRVLTWREEVA